MLVKIINNNDFIIDVDTQGFNKPENRVVIQPREIIEVEVSPKQYKKLSERTDIKIKKDR